jgi:hypothetical protein
MISPLAMVGLGVGGLVLLMLSGSSDKKQQVVINGRTWLLEKQGSAERQVTTPQGLTAVVEQAFIVYAPKLAFGPHDVMPVLAFSQIGDNPASRKLTARYPQVPVAIVSAALKDFAVKETF